MTAWTMIGASTTFAPSTEDGINGSHRHVSTAHLSVLPSAEPVPSFGSTLRRHDLAITRRPIETFQSSGAAR